MRRSSLERRQQTIFYKLFRENYTVCTTAINVIELYAGVKGSTEGQVIASVLEEVEILSLENNFLSGVGKRAGNLRKMNQFPGIADLIIASICIENNIPIVTSNLRHFEVFESLKIFDTETL